MWKHVIFWLKKWISHILFDEKLTQLRFLTVFIDIYNPYDTNQSKNSLRWLKWSKMTKMIKIEVVSTIFEPYILFLTSLASKACRIHWSLQSRKQ